jgi:hypothetical protein
VGAPADRDAAGDFGAPGDRVGVAVDVGPVFDALGVGPLEAEVEDPGAADVVAAVGGELPTPGIAEQPTAVPATTRAPIAMRVALRPRSHRMTMGTVPPP